METNPAPENPGIEDENLEKVVENMSQINPDVLEKEAVNQSEESPPPAADPGPRDRYGRPFDPSLHEVDEAGNPRINRDGYLAQKPGRPGKFGKVHAEKTGTKLPPMFQDSPPQSPAPDLQRRNAARVSTAIFIKVGVGFFGDEWIPRKEKGMDEESELTNLFEDYYRSKGLSDIPPGAALALGLCGYAAVRLHLPQTRSRFQILMDHLKGMAVKLIQFVFGLFKKFSFKGVKANASYVDPGNNGKRKDDTGPAPGETIQSPGDSGSGA